MIEPNSKYGRKLTKQEIVDCIAATGESSCSACGDEWEDHHELCEGSAEFTNAPRGHE